MSAGGVNIEKSKSIDSDTIKEIKKNEEKNTKELLSLGIGNDEYESEYDILQRDKKSKKDILNSSKIKSNRNNIKYNNNNNYGAYSIKDNNPSPLESIDNDIDTDSITDIEYPFEGDLSEFKTPLGSNWGFLRPFDVSKIKRVGFSKKHYMQEEFSKKQVVLHHTVSGRGVTGDVNTWLGTSSRIGTPIIIDYGGKINECFSSMFWIHHIGVKHTNNRTLNKQSIGIEIDNWGGLILGDGTTKKIGSKTVNTQKGSFYAAYGNKVNTPVIEYPSGFKGYRYFEEYSSEQIKTLGEILLYYHKRYNIPLDYYDDMWDYSERAMGGKPGIWTHNSYRVDKSDMHPQPNLIEMLKSLKDIV